MNFRDPPPPPQAVRFQIKHYISMVLWWLIQFMFIIVCFTIIIEGHLHLKVKSIWNKYESFNVLVTLSVRSSEALTTLQLSACKHL